MNDARDLLERRFRCWGSCCSSRRLWPRFRRWRPSPSKAREVFPASAGGPVRALRRQPRVARRSMGDSRFQV
jgi:hypothetical protein